MKKALIIIGILLVIGLALFFFFGGGKERVTDFFQQDADFGSFFDVDPQSQNDFPTPTETATSTPAQQAAYVAPALRQISLEPVSGFTTYSTSSTSTRTVSNPEMGDLLEEFLATSTAIRFQERASGHVYDVFEFLENPVKVSNITVQKVYDSMFLNDRNQFFEITAAPDNEQVLTTLARIIPATENPITGTTTEQTLQQTPISGILTNLVYFEGSNRILYSKGTQGGSEIYSADPARSAETLIARLPFREYTLESIASGQALLQTMASASVPGYAYALNLSTGALNKIIGNINGLTVKISPDQQFYLYSQSGLNTPPVIRAHDVAANTTRVIGLDTLPEKCVFSKASSAQIYCFGSSVYKSATYPDDWYKGKVFNDENLYLINLATGDVQVVYLFDEETGGFDVVHPMLVGNDEMMIFQNKYDLTLWALDLTTLNNRF